MLKRALLVLTILLAPAAVQAQRSRMLDEVRLESGTTEREISGIWGQPEERRGQWVRYRLSSGSELHLMYSPLAPHLLVHAYLYSPGRRVGDRLFSTRENIAVRAVEQIDTCRTEAGIVVPIWGEPNDYSGNLANRHYAMANGDWVRLGPDDAMQGVEVLRGPADAVVQQLAPTSCPRRTLVPKPQPSRHFERESVDPFIPPRLVADITLNETLTASDVERIWGMALPFGTDWRSYRMASGETLSMLFEPDAPHRLVYADLIPADEVTPRRSLFSNNVRARSRSLEQLDPCRASFVELRRVWGPPDYSYGSGIGRQIYMMANGDEVKISTIPQESSVTRPDGTVQSLNCPPRQNSPR